MNKLVILDLYGNLESGFNVSLELGLDRNYRPEIKVKANLPPAKEISKKYQNWYKSYYEINGSSLRIKGKKTQIKNINIESRTQECLEKADELVVSFNIWLRSESFAAIKEECIKQLNPEDKIRIIISTSDKEVRKLPWNSWELWSKYNCCEIALNSSSKSQKIEKIAREEKIMILVILGDDRGIDLDDDRKKIQELCSASKAEITFLDQPSKQKLNRYLTSDRGWDIIFFSGHSKSEAGGAKGIFYINDRDSLTIKELKNSWEKAAAKRLKIAFLNSCDGLGIAAELEKLNIPQIIVMREPVPDLVAQQFLKHFLTQFTRGISLYESVNYSRKKLQTLESKYPCASWLPVIVQNPLETPPTWHNLGGILPCPYRGLSAFGAEDAKFFFGRDKFISKLLTRVKRDAIVAVIGASGSGKSSLIFAGLIPKLKQEKQFHIVCLRPGNNPFGSLAKALYGNNSNSGKIADSKIVLSETEIKLEQNSQYLSQKIDREFEQNPGKRFVLVIDAFEELYTLCDRTQQKTFIDLLLNTVDNATNFCLLLVFRADFLNYATDERRFADALENAILLLGQMNKEELQQTIYKPAAAFEVKLEAGLGDKILTDVAASPEKLPLLEFALTQLWFKQRDARLTHQAYREIGGVEAALAQYAEQVYTNLSAAEGRRVQKILIQLVSIGGEKREATRRLATREEVKDWDLVTRLANDRLVVTNRDISTNEETVEIVHEALIRNWGRLQKWIDQDRSFRIWQDRLRQDIRQWNATEKDEGSLLRGVSLSEAEAQLKERFEDLSQAEQNFIRESIKQRDRLLKIERQRRKYQLIAVSTTAVILAGLTVVAGDRWRKAEIESIRTLKASSAAFLASNRTLDARIASLQAARKFQHLSLRSILPEKDLEKEVKQALVQTTYGGEYIFRQYNRLSTGYTVKWSRDLIDWSPDSKILAFATGNKTIKLWQPDNNWQTTLEGHSYSIVGVSWSSDGILATIDQKGNIRLWDRDGNQKKSFSIPSEQDKIYGVRWSLDGQRFAVPSLSGTIYVWQQKGDRWKELKSDSPIWGANWSPDGTIATGSEDGTIKLWKQDSPEPSKIIENHIDWVIGVSWSSDGNILASISSNIVGVYQKNGELLHSLEHPSKVLSVSWSRDRILATGTEDDKIRLWKIDGTILSTLKANGSVSSLSWSPDGRVLTALSEDGTVELWRANPLLTSLTNHTRAVNSVSWNPDGQILASGSDDRTIQLWHQDGTPYTTLNSDILEVKSVSWSPDGQILASAGYDSVQLWRRNGQEFNKPKTLDHYRYKAPHHQGSKSWINSVDWSFDGKFLATASNGARVQLWDRDGNSQEVCDYLNHSDWVYDTSWSRNGLLASAGRDSNIKIFNLKNLSLNEFAGRDRKLTSVNWHPDGKILASAGRNRIIRFWHQNGDLLKELKGHQDDVLSLSWRPDGKILASASADGNVNLWKQDGTFLITLKGHTKDVNEVTWSPDGKFLTTASNDTTVKLWRLDLNLEDTEQVFDRLLVHNCNWMREYFQTHPSETKTDRKFCQDIK